MKITQVSINGLDIEEEGSNIIHLSDNDQHNPDVVLFTETLDDAPYQIDFESLVALTGITHYVNQLRASFELSSRTFEEEGEEPVFYHCVVCRAVVDGLEQTYASEDENFNVALLGALEWLRRSAS